MSEYENSFLSSLFVSAFTAILLYCQISTKSKKQGVAIARMLSGESHRLKVLAYLHFR